MRRRGPAYTFEPYERVPDGQSVPQPQLSGWRLRVWRAGFIAFCLLVPLLIIVSAVKHPSQ